MTDARDYMLWHLSRLADELDARGCMPTLECVDDPMPRLWVRDERIDQRIFVAPVDGVWWYWWPWVERIKPSTDVPGAAVMICAVSRAEA